MKKFGIWVEVTTLLIPGLNDSKEELERIAEFIASVGLDIPWHISRFHPEYKYTKKAVTPSNILSAAARIGKEMGLRYVYIGNVAGEPEDTVCYSCGELLIKRYGFVVQEMKLTGNFCPRCHVHIDGMF